MERPWATRTRKLGVSREAKRNHEVEAERWAGAWGALGNLGGAWVVSRETEKGRRQPLVEGPTKILRFRDR